MRNVGSAAALSLCALALASLGWLVACGGEAKPAAGPTTKLDGGADATAPGLALSPPPSGLPALAPMPPLGVAGSKKAKKKREASSPSASESSESSHTKTKKAKKAAKV